MTQDTSPFQRALEGEQLTAEEVAQVWREAPVTYVSPAEYDAILEMLDAEPREVPQLRALIEKTREDFG